MGTPFQQEGQVAQVTQLESANLFELSCGTSKLSYTASNIAGDPIVTYDNGSVGRTFIGDQIRREITDLGTLVTVTLEVLPASTNLLTLVLPEVLVYSEGPPEKVSAPVVFHTLNAGSARPRTQPGPVQSYDVKIFSGTARLIFT